MKKYLFLLAFLPFMTACENTWDSESKDMFVQGCMNAAKDDMPEDKAKAMCDCRLEKVMEKYPKFADAMEHITELPNDPAMQECE